MTSDLFNNHSGGWDSASTVRCHSTHKVLKLGAGEIVGASCSSPRDGFDIYIGFCFTMKFQHQPYPWELKTDPIIEFQYSITDMCAPKSPKKFKQMIEWVADQIKEGKRIHVGCIGGHGRTGTFLAALVAHMKINDDPIKWVRKHHCKKAVESASQVKFLVKHFGCKTAKPTKQHQGTQTGRLSGRESHNSNVSDIQKGSGYRRKKTQKQAARRLGYVAKKGSIWG